MLPSAGPRTHASALPFCGRAVCGMTGRRSGRVDRGMAEGPPRASLLFWLSCRWFWLWRRCRGTRRDWRAGPRHFRSGTSAAASGRAGSAPAVWDDRCRPGVRGAAAPLGGLGPGPEAVTKGPTLRRPRGPRGPLEGGALTVSGTCGRDWLKSVSDSPMLPAATPSVLPGCWSAERPGSTHTPMVEDPRTGWI